jgi:hypothetical protein
MGDALVNRGAGAALDMNRCALAETTERHE